MNLQELLDFIDFIADKNQEGNTITPANYNILLQAVNEEYYHKLLDVYEVNQQETNSIRRFKVPGATIAVSSGVASLPSDYAYPSALTYKYVVNSPSYTWREIDILTDAEFSSRESSTIENPTMRNPIAKFVESTLIVRPVEVKTVFFTYLRVAATPVYAYTKDSNDNTVYNASASTELDYEEEDKIKIAGFILSKLGINLREAELVQYAEMIKEDKQ